MIKYVKSNDFVALPRSYVKNLLTLKFGEFHFGIKLGDDAIFIINAFIFAYMKSGYIVLGLLVCMVSACFSQSKDLCRGFEAINEKNFGIALKIFDQFKKKNASLCAFAKSKIYFESKDFYSLDSALFNIQYAMKYYGKDSINYSKKELAKYGAKGWTEKSIQFTYLRILEEKFSELERKNSIHHWNDFIQKYENSNFYGPALTCRDSLWLDSCSNGNLFCFLGLRVTNPVTVYKQKLDEEIEFKEFEEWVIEKSESELSSFLIYHPLSRFASFAEDEIYKLYKDVGDTNKLIYFINTYKNNRNLASIWKAYYSSFIGNYNPELMSKFILLHPDYPLKSQVAKEIEWFGRMLFPILNEAGLFGFMDEEGNKVIEPHYEEVSDFHEGLAVVLEEGKYGVISINGDVVIKSNYQVISDFHQGVAIFKDKGKYGIFDRNERILIEAKFDDIQFVFDSLLLFMEDGKYGIMNRNGKVLYHAEFNDVRILDENKLLVTKINNIGVINSNFTQILEVVFDEVVLFNKGFIGKKDGKYGVFDLLGHPILLLQYDDINQYNDQFLSVTIDNKFSYFSIKDSRFISPWIPIYENWKQLSGFNGVTFLAYKNGRYCWLDTNGKALKTLNVHSLNSVGNIITGKLESNQELGIMNRSGEALTPFYFDQIQVVDCQMLKVFKDGKVGLFSAQGIELLAPIYDEIGFWPLSKLWWVEQDDKKGVFTNELKEILPPVYHAISEFSTEIISLQLETELLYYNFIKNKLIKQNK